MDLTLSIPLFSCLSSYPADSNQNGEIYLCVVCYSADSNQNGEIYLCVVFLLLLSHIYAIIVHLITVIF